MAAAFDEDLVAITNCVASAEGWKPEDDPGIPVKHSIRDAADQWLGEPMALFPAVAKRSLAVEERLPKALWSELRRVGEELLRARDVSVTYPREYLRLNQVDAKVELFDRKLGELRDRSRASVVSLLAYGAALREYEEGSRVEALEAKTEEANQAIEQSKTAARELGSLGDQTRNALAVLQTAALNKALDGRAAAFRLEKEAHDKTATFWLWATILFAACLISVGLVSIASGKGPPVPIQPWYVAANLAHFAARALIASVLSFLLVASVRNYRSSKHNAITNAHRAGALQTFETFTTGAEGTKVADAVVLQASLAAFAPQPTGFDDQKQTSLATHASELLELLKDRKPPNAD